MAHACDGCGAEVVALVVIASPRGEYGLCRKCYCEPARPKRQKRPKGTRKKKRAPKGSPLFEG